MPLYGFYAKFGYSRKLDIPSMMIGILTLKSTKTDKYLGVIFSDNLLDNLDMERQARAIYLQGNITVNKFNNYTNNVSAVISNLWYKFVCCTSLA